MKVMNIYPVLGCTNLVRLFFRVTVHLAYVIGAMHLNLNRPAFCHDVSAGSTRRTHKVTYVAIKNRVPKFAQLFTSTDRQMLAATIASILSTPMLDLRVTLSILIN